MSPKRIRTVANKLALFPSAPFISRRGRVEDYALNKAIVFVAFGVGGIGAGTFAHLLKSPYPVTFLLFCAWAASASCLAAIAHERGLLRYRLSLGAAISLLVATAVTVESGQ